MKKTTILIITVISLIVFLMGSFLFVKKARENRSWPFNSSLSNYFPKSIKNFGYKITNPDKIILETHFYDIEAKYHAIPSSNAVGNGGGLNIFDEKNLLTILDNGELFLFNIHNLDYTRINSNLLINKYSSIRDAYYSSGELIIFGVIEVNEECSKISLDKYSINKDANNNISLENEKLIWSSEKNCNDPQINNAGGRVIKFKEDFFISTGYFTPNINSGINPFPQNYNSSFGKILKIDDTSKKTIFSVGHRNPQGLFLYNDEYIISSEHGPKGGDEINLILYDKNYGWPCKTFGTLYSYENTGNKKEIWPNFNDLEKFGCKRENNYTDPLFTWTPSIAASQGMQYKSTYFKKFQNDIILGSLRATSLFRINLNKDLKVINMERININERIRDIIETQDGKIAVYSDGGSIILFSKINKD